jgi:hypothetical protein
MPTAAEVAGAASSKVASPAATEMAATATPMGTAPTTTMAAATLRKGRVRRRRKH